MTVWNPVSCKPNNLYSNVKPATDQRIFPSFQLPVDPLTSFVVQGYKEQPTTVGGKPHTGVDITVRTGHNVYALHDGVVTKVERGCVVVQYVATSKEDENDKATNRQVTATTYCCVNASVRERTGVNHGDLIGRVASTCGEAMPSGTPSVPHVHLEVVHSDAGKPSSYRSVNPFLKR